MNISQPNLAMFLPIPTTTDPHKAHVCREPLKRSRCITTAQRSRPIPSERHNHYAFIKSPLAISHPPRPTQCSQQWSHTGQRSHHYKPSSRRGAICGHRSTFGRSFRPKGRSRRGQRLQEALLHLRWLCLCFFGIYRPSYRRRNRLERLSCDRAPTLRERVMHLRWLCLRVGCSGCVTCDGLLVASPGLHVTSVEPQNPLVASCGIAVGTALLLLAS